MPRTMHQGRQCTGWAWGVVALCLAPLVHASPWLEPGDSVLRHDVQVLADAGILRGPVTSWPLSWPDIARGLDEVDPAQSQTSAVHTALLRVREHATLAARRGWSNSMALRATHHPETVRTYADTARGTGEVIATADWLGQDFAARLRATALADAPDGQVVRADGSYLATHLGNWALSYGSLDRWWGPGWDGSLIWSNNARPIPGVTVQRNLTDAPESRWLHWLGPWQLTVFTGQLEDNREIPSPLFSAARLAFKPLASVEIGISRTAQWGGQGRSETPRNFFNMVIGKDNTDKNNLIKGGEPGNQLGGFDLRWGGEHQAFYAQVIGEDECAHLPCRDIGLFGAEHWGSWHDNAYRLWLEYADTAVDFLHRPTFGVAYRHGVFTDGYTFHRAVIGDSLGGDGQQTSLGGVWLPSLGPAWTGHLRRITTGRGGVALHVWAADVGLQLERGPTTWRAGVGTHWGDQDQQQAWLAWERRF